VHCRIWCSALVVLAVVVWSWDASCVHCESYCSAHPRLHLLSYSNNYDYIHSVIQKNVIYKSTSRNSPHRITYDFYKCYLYWDLSACILELHGIGTFPVIYHPVSRMT